MLDLDVDIRIIVIEVLVYSYLSQYVDSTDEFIVESYDQSFEDMEFIILEWKGWNFIIYIQDFFYIVKGLFFIFVQLKCIYFFVNIYICKFWFI